MRIAFLCTLLILSSCSSPKVVSFYNEQVDFSKYTTFEIINPANPDDKISDRNIQSDENIENAIRKEMNFRGYRAEVNSNLWVFYRVILDNRSDVHINDYSLATRTFPYATVNTYNYKEGILMIEMKDSGTRKTIWQGSLDLKIGSRKTNTDALQEAMRLIFEDYPFRAGKGEPAYGPTNP